MVTKRFRIAARIEATTYLVMIAAALWRTTARGPDLSMLTGPAHGMAFTGYLITTLQARHQLGWSNQRTLLSVLAATIPIGGYIVAKKQGHAKPSPNR
jgi:integral membrane protein